MNFQFRLRLLIIIQQNTMIMSEWEFKSYNPFTRSVKQQRAGEVVGALVAEYALRVMA